MSKFWMSSSVWATSLLLSSLVLGAPAPADTSDSYEGPPRAALEYQGQPGFWFRNDVARKMLEDLKLYELAKERESLYEQKIGIMDQQRKRFEEAHTISLEAEKRSTEALSISETRRAEAEEALDAWYRQPWLWGSLGLVAGVVLTTVIVYASK